MPVKPTKTQLALIREGVRNPDKLPPTFGSGGGSVVGDPRTIRALIAQGMAFRQPLTFHRVDSTRAYLTKAAFALVGAPAPTRRHPFDNEKEWP